AELDDAYAADHPGVNPGPYVMISVSDIGVGMEDIVLQHLFEPFFTTKPTGHGTGLGLATVYGIVSQSQGHISTYSEPGIGTTFKLYLPMIDAPLTTAEPHALMPTVIGGTETILLVEDDDLVRGYTETILQS